MMAAVVRSPLTKEAHGNASVAQTTPAHLNDLYRSVMEANEFSGPATQLDRLAEWQTLQELARLRPTGAA